MTESPAPTPKTPTDTEVRRTLTVLGAAALILIVLFGGALYTDHVNNPRVVREAVQAESRPSKKYKAVESEKYEKAAEEHSEEKRLADLTLWLVIFTAILAVGTSFLWRATERLVRGAEDTSERQLRAYVHVKSIIIYNIFAGGYPEAEITVINSGQTPAKNLLLYSHIALWEDAPRKPLALPKNTDPSSAPLAPQENIVINLKCGTAMTPKDIENIKNGDYAFFVRGIINYRDIFDKNRCTNFKSFSTKHIGTERKLMTVYMDGNDFT